MSEPGPSLHALMVKEKRRVALTSVAAAVLLTGGKLVVGLWTGSLGILSEAAHSGLDFLAAIITFFAVNVSDRPADEDHQYGHGKIENLSALAETILLLITCGWILWEAWSRLVYGHGEIDVNVVSFAVIGASILIDIGRSRALYKVARRYNSQALEADALHFSTDIYSSLVVIVGLVAVRLGFPAGDSIAAAGVACIVIWISLRLGKRTIDVLLDRTPTGVKEKVTAAVVAIQGVESIRSVRTRQAGAHLFIEIVIGIRRTLTFDQAHLIMDDVERVVHAAVPRSDVMVHADPVLGGDERIADAVHWLVQQHALSPHNILVLRADGRTNIDMDIEYPPGTTFVDAHHDSVKIEERIRGEIPDIGEVCVHLEEERPAFIASHDVTASETVLVHRIRKLVESSESVSSCNSIACYMMERGLKISIACSLSGIESLDDSHNIVNAIENEILALDARITKVFIHAEPEGDWKLKIEN